MDGWVRAVAIQSMCMFVCFAPNAMLYDDKRSERAYDDEIQIFYLLSH